MIWDKRTAGAGIAALVFLGWFGVAEAQTAMEDSVANRPRPELDPIGILVGPEGGFLLFPKVELAGEYTDNLFRTNTGESSDVIGFVTPSIKIQSDWDRHSVSLGGTTTYAKHADNSDEDWWDYTVNTAGRLDVSDTGAITGRIDFSRKHVMRDSADDPSRTSPTRYTVAGAMGHSWISRIRLVASVRSP